MGARDPVSRFGRDDGSSEVNPHKVRRFIAKPANVQGITKRLTFDDQDTLTFLPQPKSDEITVPSLLDLLKEFATYLASLRKSRIAISPERETSVVSRSNVSMKSISPLRPMNALLPKRKGRIQVCEDEAMDFGRDDDLTQEPKFEDTEADFRNLLRQNRQIDLSIDDDETLPEPAPVRSQFPLREIPKRKPLQEKPALPKRKSRVTFDESTTEVNTAFMAKAIANCPQMNLDIDDEDLETKAVFDSRFDDEHSAILPRSSNHPFFLLKDYDLTLDMPAFDRLFKFLVGVFPKEKMQKLREKISAESEKILQEATKLSEQHQNKRIDIPNGDVVQEMEHRCAGEAFALLMQTVMPGLEFFAEVSDATEVLQGALAAVQRHSTPSAAMDDVDRMIEELRERSKQTRNGDGVNEKYEQLRESLPFRVTRIAGSAVSAVCGREQISMKEITGDMLHARIANDERYKKFRSEFLELMTFVPDITFVDQMLSFVVSSEKRGFRFAVVLKVPSYYPWCHCTVLSVRIDFGVKLEDVLGTVKEVASGIPMGNKWLTRFIRKLFERFQV